MQIAEGAARDRWDHTAALLCLIYNAHAPRGKSASVEDFHPLRKRERRGMTAEQLRGLRPVFESWGQS